MKSFASNIFTKSKRSRIQRIFFLTITINVIFFTCIPMRSFKYTFDNSPSGQPTYFFKKCSLDPEKVFKEDGGEEFLFSLLEMFKKKEYLKFTQTTDKGYNTFDSIPLELQNIHKDKNQLANLIAKGEDFCGFHKFFENDITIINVAPEYCEKSQVFKGDYALKYSIGVKLTSRDSEKKERFREFTISGLKNKKNFSFARLTDICPHAANPEIRYTND